jgi:hypothetical protein
LKFFASTQMAHLQAPQANPQTQACKRAIFCQGYILKRILETDLTPENN